MAAYYYRERDYNAVLNYLKIAAARLPQARCDLGLCHKLGIGTQRDPQLARKRFEEAAAQGCAEADYYLVRPNVLAELDCYCKTDLIRRDEMKTIIDRLHRPADSGNALACDYLGICYYLLSTADSNAQAKAKALKYLRLAADYGIRQAKEMVVEFEKQTKIERLSYAFIIDNDATRNVYTQGVYSYIYADPNDDQQRENAVNYLRKASQYGISRATDMVAEFDQTGHISVLENYDTSIIDDDNYALSQEGYLILD